MSVTLLPGGTLPAVQTFGKSETTDESDIAYRVDWPGGTYATGGVNGGAEGMRQALFKYLQTWRGRYPIYDGQYGIELHDLVGREREYVCALLPGRIRDALSVDERVVGADGFAFEDAGRDGLLCSFTVHTVFGDIAQSVSVEA